MGPAEQLEGMKLANGWRVAEKLTLGEHASGAIFSTGYRVENADGRVAYMKAMDYAAAFESENVAEATRVISDAYLFEKQICDACRDRHCDRIASAIDAGEMRANAKDPYTHVHYLIFDLAEGGDIRRYLDRQHGVDLTFTFRVLHHVAVGLDQLHKAEMAHQDLKPSNVLVYGTQAGSRIGDLGRAWAKCIRSPYDKKRIAGDKGYAPPEMLYPDVPRSEESGRYACDLYHLGSLVTFMFCRVNMSGLLIRFLALEHRPVCWAGSYADVLPYVKMAFAGAIDELSSHVPAEVREKVTAMVLQLCEPDPAKRGHPLNQLGHANQFSLERYIAELDLIATRLERGMQRSESHGQH